MGTNSRTRTVRVSATRRRRKTDPYAVYDALPAPIRAALQEGPQEWDAISIRRRLRQLSKLMLMDDAVTRMVRFIYAAHAYDIELARPWQKNPDRKMPEKYRVPSPHQLAQATMQTSGRGVY